MLKWLEKLLYMGLSNRSLVAKLALLPLVKGQFNVQRMELNNAQINFEMLENGKLN